MMKWFKKHFLSNFNLGMEDFDSIRIEASVPNLGTFNFQIHGGIDQYISRDLQRDKIWEPFETEVFRRLCRAGDKILDIGANIGWYSVIASRIIGESGKVISFEPDLKNLEILKVNIKLSGGAGKVDVLNLALGDKEANSKLFLSKTNLGDHRVFSSEDGRDFSEVKVQTLDNLFSKIKNKPTIVKCDTQGSEARIFLGANQLFFEGWRPLFILEYWPYGLVNAGSDPEKFLEKILSLDYQLFELSEAYPKLIPFTKERYSQRICSDISPESQGFINLLCIPSKSERLDSVLDLVEDLI